MDILHDQDKTEQRVTVNSTGDEMKVQANTNTTTSS
jgi:hypothetical protein